MSFERRIMELKDYGFIRVAAASPALKVADCDYNIGEIKSILEHASRESVQIVCFPELSLTGYSCGDLFLQEALQRKAIDALKELAIFMQVKPALIAIVGLPLRIKNSLFNVAAVVSSEGIMG